MQVFRGLPNWALYLTPKLTILENNWKYCLYPCPMKSHSHGLLGIKRKIEEKKKKAAKFRPFWVKEAHHFRKCFSRNTSTSLYRYNACTYMMCTICRSSEVFRFELCTWPEAWLGEELKGQTRWTIKSHGLQEGSSIRIPTRNCYVCEYKKNVFSNECGLFLVLIWCQVVCYRVELHLDLPKLLVWEPLGTWLLLGACYDRGIPFFGENVF